ncbi:hypothetical protein NCS52_01417400 [Fusarium sp. LHS14.1]|nr:hypothetical protein NCS52_01417400 [Fusarium sp. LHS14.1]
MSTNQKNTVSEKKDAVVPASGSETAPSNDRFLGGCESIGFLPLLEPSYAQETKPTKKEESRDENDFFDANGGRKDCCSAFSQPQEESRMDTYKEASYGEDEIFDANGGLKNCPGAFPVDEPEAESQAQRKRCKEKQE